MIKINLWIIIKPCVLHLLDRFKIFITVVRILFWYGSILDRIAYCWIISNLYLRLFDHQLRIVLTEFRQSQISGRLLFQITTSFFFRMFMLFDWFSQNFKSGRVSNRRIMIDCLDYLAEMLAVELVWSARFKKVRKLHFFFVWNERCFLTRDTWVYSCDLL